MTRQELLHLLEEGLDVDQGTLLEGDRLRQMPYWDSMSPVAVMALADKRFGKKLLAKDIQRCQTVGELVQLFGDAVKD